MYDSVVVGGGPASSRFACRVAGQGFDVVFEQGEVGKPLACSGRVSTDIREFVPESAHERLFENETYGSCFQTGDPGGESHRFWGDEVVSSVIDRVEGYFRDLRRVVDDDNRDPAVDSVLSGVTARRKRIEALDGGVDPAEAERLVSTLRALRACRREGGETALARAQERLQ